MNLCIELVGLEERLIVQERTLEITSTLRRQGRLEVIGLGDTRPLHRNDRLRRRGRWGGVKSPPGSGRGLRHRCD